MANISGREVISFFKNADLELAELVLEFGQTAVEARVETRNKISANLKKARAARKPAVQAATTEATSVESATPVAPIAEAPTVVRRGRPPAHAHTMAAPQGEQATEASA